jgi:hypothetical protein
MALLPPLIPCDGICWLTVALFHDELSDDYDGARHIFQDMSVGILTV